MPNEVPQNDGPSELEKLIANAESEAKRVAIPAIEHPPIKCSHAFDDPLLQVTECKSCHSLNCADCLSILDPIYCKHCLSEKDAELHESTPPPDDDGVIPAGRVLTPDPNARFYQPRFGTLAENISGMNTAELEAHIKRYQDLLRQAEKTLDIRRIVLGTSQIEQEQRKAIERRKLRADKTRYAVKTLTVDKKTGEQKKQGVSVEKLTEMFRMLEALSTLKKQTEVKK